MVTRKKSSPPPKRPKRPKKTPPLPKTLRGLIRALPDRIKKALIHCLVEMAKTDARAAKLYATYSGEGGAFAVGATDHICCFSVELPSGLSVEEEEEMDQASALIEHKLRGEPDEEDEPEDEQRERYV